MTQLTRGQIDLLLLLIGEKWSREAEADLRGHIAALDAELKQARAELAALRLERTP